MIAEGLMLRNILAVAMLAGIVAAQTTPARHADTDDRLLPGASSSANQPTGEEIFEKLLEHNRLRETLLAEYSAVRTYSAGNHKGKVYAEETVRLQYRAPGAKSFTTVRANGSSIVRSRVFAPLMASEAEAAAGRSHHDSSITPANYSFQFAGREDTDACHCFVVQAVPKRQDKYLFAGTIWIDEGDFAIVKIAGSPARNPSFWIKHVEFVRTYQKIGQFWLPSRDYTEVEMKMLGDKILTIDHGEYAINDNQRLQGEAQKGETAAATNF
jgi:hypothetical protein